MTRKATTKKKTTARRSWSELGPGERVGVLVAGSVQLALAATAWTDLARRPASRVTGPKAVWAGIIGLNYVGPIAYFIIGRKRSSPPALVAEGSAAPAAALP